MIQTQGNCLIQIISRVSFSPFLTVSTPQTDSEPLLPLHYPPPLRQLQGCSFCRHGNPQRGSAFNRAAAIPARQTDPGSTGGQSERTGSLWYELLKSLILLSSVFSI